ncbi:hypothetical protein FACS1894116_00650 [Betaproteobacteria bacterium]|nr:hypothetical protein FACS1894116_00650 [Betaproteobacteria bacterium]GHU28386.1 hypothetical protein FACS189497_03730 [Betaproteobacteria bacterium]
MLINCFTYGSLMYEPIMSAICASKCAGVPATLPGYRRHPIRDEDYPAMVPDAAASVSGILYRDLPAAALTRLDAFEGEQYVRRPVTVLSADGTQLDAESYIFRPQYAELLLPGEWDYARFLASGRHRFEQQYGGFRRV